MQRFLRSLFFIALGIFLLIMVYYLRSVFLPFAIAVFFAYIIYPLVKSLEEREISKERAIVTVFLAGTVLILLFLFLFLPSLFKEAKSFGKILPIYAEYWDYFQNYTTSIIERSYLPVEVDQILRETFNKIQNNLLQMFRGFANGVLGSIALLPSFLLAPFLSYYLLKDSELLKKRFLAIWPPGSRSDLLYFLHEVDVIFSMFLRGHLFISVIVGFLTALGAALIGLNFYLLIGLLTAVADLVPVFGPLLAAFPVVGFALAESKIKGILMLVIFLLVQQFESSFLVPRLMGDRLGLHPLAVVLAILAGGYLFGPLGLILAVPSAGLIRLTIEFIWSKLV